MVSYIENLPLSVKKLQLPTIAQQSGILGEIWNHKKCTAHRQ